MAIPCPPPIHADPIPYLALRRLITILNIKKN